MRFRDQVVLLTGASGGVGRKLIESFVKEDAKVAAVRHAHKIEENEQILDIEADLGCASDCELAVQMAITHFGKIDIFIHAAATTADSFAEKMTPDDWDKVLAVNLSSASYLTRHILPHMKELGGHIIFLSSVVGEEGALGCSNYAASKAGLIGLGKALAKETTRLNIFVNILSLGYFNIGLGAVLPLKIREKIESTIPLRRFGDPEEIVRAVFYLSETTYMTGSILRVSGGL